MNLNIFDFDDTLFRIPTYSSAPANFKVNDVNKWYDHPESLNDGKYNIQLITNMANELNAIKNNRDDKNMNVLVTRRVPELASQILRLLRKHDLHFDKHFIIGHNKLKSQTLHEILTEDLINEDIERINIYEDSLVQILDYQRYFKKLESHIETNFIFVDKTHIIHIFDIGAEVLDKIKLSY